MTRRGFATIIGALLASLALGDRPIVAYQEPDAEFSPRGGVEDYPGRRWSKAALPEDPEVVLTDSETVEDDALAQRTQPGQVTPRTTTPPGRAATPAPGRPTTIAPTSPPTRPSTTPTAPSPFSTAAGAPPT